MSVNSLERIKVVNEVVKTLFTVLIAVVLFIFIQQPGTILTREKTEEETRRDRAKLLVEIASIEDDVQQRSALAAVQYAYRGHDNSFFENIEGLMNIGRSTTALRRDAQMSILTSEQCIQLNFRLAELREELVDKSALAEFEKLTGEGPSYRAAALSIQELSAELSVIQETVAQKCEK